MPVPKNCRLHMLAWEAGTDTLLIWIMATIMFFVRHVALAGNWRADSELNRGTEEDFMRRWTGAAVVALTLILGGSAAIKPAAAAPSQTVAQKSQAGSATDFSARRYYRRYYGYGYRPYYQRYYARPYYYRPYPYYAPYYGPAPIPFGFGFGFGPWGW
jgi:hypothetical protein